MIALPNWRCKIGRHRPVVRSALHLPSTLYIQDEWMACGLCGKFLAGEVDDLGWKGPKHRSWHEWPLVGSLRHWWQGKRAWRP